MGKKEIIISIVWMAITFAVLTASLNLGIGPFHNPGPGFMGFCAGALLAVLSGALIATALMGKEKSAPFADLWKDRDWHIPLIVVAALVLYCLALPGLGYLTATFVLMAVLFALNRIKVWQTISGALLLAVSTFVLFDFLLKVPLPRGIFGF
jgi:putative tricarboxylic transport membrane protein